MKISIGELFINNDADIILHPIKYKDSITYEPSSEEAVLALMAKYLIEDKLPNEVKDYFDDLDEGYLFSESNFDEFDLEIIKSKLDKTNQLFIGRDILLHPQKENILKIASLFKIIGFEVNYFIDDYKLQEIEEIDSFDGAIVYFAEGNNNEILVSQQFKIANKIKNDTIFVNSKEKKVVLEDNLKGVFGIVFENIQGYPFKRVKIN